MNATFSIHRLGLTIYKELQEKYMIILTTIGIILMTYLAIWALNLIDGEPVTAAARAASAATILSIIGCLAPFFLYKNENRRMEGVFYAVSPSSTLEKTISMLVICSVIFPLLSTVLLMSLDSLLTLMPFEASYSGSIWGCMFSSKDYLDKITSIMPFNTDPMSIDLVNRMFDTVNPLSIPPIVGLALSQSAFVLLNMLFRRHKIGYTLLTLLGAWVIAAVIMVISAVSFFDSVAKVDDPVGAISVHGVCGSLGTILTGIFALDGGLLYGGGLHMLGVQLLGAAVYAAWAILCGLILFYVLRRTIGLRVDRRVEEDGLDYYEHGETSYNI